METTIMALTIDHRIAKAPEIQIILTKYGCIIKTRLGLHESNEDSCSQRGLILLHLSSNSNEVQKLENELNQLEGIKVKYMTL